MTLEEIFNEEDKSEDIFDGFTEADFENTNKIIDNINNEKKEESNVLDEPSKENENITESNITLNEVPTENDFEKTLDIETLDLNTYLGQNFENIDNTEEKPKQEIKKEKEHSIQESFINCSVLGFLTAFIGAGWFINIINQL